MKFGNIRARVAKVGLVLALWMGPQLAVAQDPASSLDCMKHRLTKGAPHALCTLNDELRSTPTASALDVQAVLACTKIPSDLERLLCFDAATKGAGPEQTAFSDAQRQQLKDMLNKSYKHYRTNGRLNIQFIQCDLVLTSSRGSAKPEIKGRRLIDKRKIDLSKVDLDATGQVTRGSFGYQFYQVVAQPGAALAVSGVKEKNIGSMGLNRWALETYNTRPSHTKFPFYKVEPFELERFDKLFKAAIAACQ